MSESPRKSQVTLEGEPVLEDWSFAKENTSYHVHGLHEYPARMIPQIAERLLNLYTKESDTILDPFCGSGTTLVEARLAARNSIGTDTNPLAVLIASAKSRPIDFKEKDFRPIVFLNEIERKYQNVKGALPPPPLEIVPNLLHWFKKEVASDLEFLHNEITGFPDEEIRTLLKVAFSLTVFRTSNIDHRSSRFIRTLDKERLEKFHPNVLLEFHRNVADSVKRVKAYSRKLQATGREVEAKILQQDARRLPIPEETIDGIITSPPYGEEKNTVGYSRWAKLSIAWLRLDDGKIARIQKRSLGAIRKDDAVTRLTDLPTPTATELLGRLARVDIKRVQDAIPFFFDYHRTLREMHRVLKRKAHCCVVIGNRSIRQVPLNMEKVTVELANHVGFNHKKSFYRQIPLKLIPWDTPTGKTISKENIIIFEKT